MFIRFLPMSWGVCRNSRGLHGHSVQTVAQSMQPEFTEDAGRRSVNVNQLPMYRAYRLRAMAGSVVPLMIALPSGNNVNS